MMVKSRCATTSSGQFVTGSLPALRLGAININDDWLIEGLLLINDVTRLTLNDLLLAHAAHIVEIFVDNVARRQLNEHLETDDDDGQVIKLSQSGDDVRNEVYRKDDVRQPQKWERLQVEGDVLILDQLKDQAYLIPQLLEEARVRSGHVRIGTTLLCHVIYPYPAYSAGTGYFLSFYTQESSNSCQSDHTIVAGRFASATIFADMIVTILKLLIVLVFLIAFLRRPSIVWGVGLLTVATAVLLDTFLGTFGREEMLAQLGFFYYVLVGALIAGTAFWLLGLLRPAWANPNGASSATGDMPRELVLPGQPSTPTAGAGYASAGYDRQMLYQEIHDHFGRQDVEDLLFDLQLNELDVTQTNQTLDHLVLAILNAADQSGQQAELALAVERILTPLPPEHLPRVENLSADSPAILRMWLLAHYDLAGLQRVTTELGIDWESLSSPNKRELARELLRYLDRRDQTDKLLQTVTKTA